MKAIIGIVPKGDLFDQEKSNMSDTYTLGNNYIKRVQEAGGVPVGIAPVDGWILQDVLDMCDGFIVQGGKDYYPYHFQIVHHAVVTGKKYLGICMGMQVIHSYFMLRHVVENRGYEGDLVQAIWELYNDPERTFDTLGNVEGHRSQFAPRGREDDVKHEVRVVSDTLLHQLTGREMLRGATFHNYCILTENCRLKVNAWSADGVAEGVEYENNILGVQFHPEVDDKLKELFTFLTK